MFEIDTGFLLDFGCLLLSFLTMVYIYRLKKIIHGSVVFLMLMGFIVNVVLRIGYLLGSNMHPYFIFSYLFTASGFIFLFYQVQRVIHAPISKAEAAHKKADLIYAKATEAHIKTLEVYRKSQEAVAAAVEVIKRTREIFDAEK